MADYGQPVFSESVSFVTGSAGGARYALGTRRVDEGGNLYVYGYNASAVVLEPGCPVLIGSSNTGYSFTATNAASQVGLIAACVHNASIATDSYGWFMVRGLCRIAPDGTTGAVSMDAGKYLTVGVAANGQGGWTSCPATLATGMRFGYSVESIVTGYGGSASHATSGLAAMGRGWIKTLLG